jgi:hypothetical protein
VAVVVVRKKGRERRGARHRLKTGRGSAMMRECECGVGFFALLLWLSGGLASQRQRQRQRASLFSFGVDGRRTGMADEGSKELAKVWEEDGGGPG